MGLSEDGVDRIFSPASAPIHELTELAVSLDIGSDLDHCLAAE